MARLRRLDDQLDRTEPMAEGAAVTVAGDESGHDPADRAIMAAWKAVLPRHGLLP